MDAFFADPIVVRPDEHRWYAEEVVNLPGVLSLAPPFLAPPIAPLPALSCGHVTFGSYNRPIKITSAVLETWAAHPPGRPGLAAAAQARPPGL